MPRDPHLPSARDPHRRDPLVHRRACAARRAWPTRRISSAGRARRSPTFAATGSSRSRRPAARRRSIRATDSSRRTSSSRAPWRPRASSFIGPTPEAIEKMGLKDRAKAIMEKAGVPVVPGYHGENQDAKFLREQAKKVGFPLLIKAVAGGGGKGMRLVTKDDEFDAAARRREARGTRRLRRRPRAARALCPGPAPHRVPGLRRHARQLRAPLRARVLDPAAPPEGARGDALALRRRRHAREDGRSRRRRRARHRLPRRGHHRVHRRRRPQVLLHGDEHAPAGRAPGHRDDHGRGSRRMAIACRGGRAAAAAAIGNHVAAATRSRCASAPRIPPTISFPRPAASASCAPRPGRSTRSSASTPACDRATR